MSTCRTHDHLSVRSDIIQDIFSIAPKRPNWDLKREMERKLTKLERKTQEAILHLTRERFLVGTRICRMSKVDV